MRNGYDDYTNGHAQNLPPLPPFEELPYPAYPTQPPGQSQPAQPPGQNQLNQELIPDPAPAKRRKTLALLIAGIALMLAGVTAILLPIAQRAYLSYVMELDANAFLERIGKRTHYESVNEEMLLPADVVEMPPVLADEGVTPPAAVPTPKPTPPQATPPVEAADVPVEDETDYYNPDGTVRADAAKPPPAKKPDPYAILEIPSIDLKIGLYTSEKFNDIYTHMRYGAGIYSFSTMPGTLGNCSIAAHRTGPSDFFRYINKLAEGDEMIVHTADASYKYYVEAQYVIFPEATSIVSPTDYPAITLTTCQAYEGVSNARRLVVRGRLMEVAQDA